MFEPPRAGLDNRKDSIAPALPAYRSDHVDLHNTIDVHLLHGCKHHASSGFHDFAFPM